MFRNTDTLFNYYRNRKITKITWPSRQCGDAVYSDRILVSFSDNATMEWCVYMGDRSRVNYKLFEYKKDNHKKTFMCNVMEKKLYDKIINHRNKK